MRVAFSLSCFLLLSLVAGCVETRSSTDDARSGSDAGTGDASTPDVDSSTPAVDSSPPEVDASTPEVDASMPADAGGSVDAAPIDAGPVELTPMAVCSRLCAALIACAPSGMEPEMCVMGCSEDLGDCPIEQLAQISACEDDGCGSSMMGGPPAVVECAIMVACVMGGG